MHHTPIFDTFPRTWRTYQRRDFSSPTPFGRHFVAELASESEDIKGQLSTFVEAICRYFRQHFSQYPPNILPISSQYSPTGDGRKLRVERSELRTTYGHETNDLRHANEKRNLFGAIRVMRHVPKGHPHRQVL